MGLTTTTWNEFGHESARISDQDGCWIGAHVRVLADGLHGLEGTVISVRGDNRLLIRLHGIRDVCLEIDAQAVAFLGGPT